MTEQIKNRTKKIGLEIIKLIDDFPNKTSAWVIAKQLVRSATSIGTNYSAACRAKSQADFIKIQMKLCIGLKSLKKAT